MLVCVCARVSQLHTSNEWIKFSSANAIEILVSWMVWISQVWQIGTLYKIKSNISSWFNSFPLNTRNFEMVCKQNGSWPEFKSDQTGKVMLKEKCTWRKGQNEICIFPIGYICLRTDYFRLQIFQIKYKWIWVTFETMRS